MEQVIKVARGNQEVLVAILGTIVYDENLYIVAEDEAGKNVVWRVMPQGLRVPKPQDTRTVEELFRLHVERRSEAAQGAELPPQRVLHEHIHFYGGELEKPPEEEGQE